MDNITEYEIRKRDMKELWKDTFHDSERYIDIVFDRYYSLENTFVRYHENRIIAALLSVGYEFQILTKEGKKENRRGMYLCGLATRPEWRGRGIMTEVMKEAETAAISRGYDMTFLIPADDELREYYRRRGYETAAWRSIETYRQDTEEPKNSNDALHIYSMAEYRKKYGNGRFLEELAEWCMKEESLRKNNTILHSREDMLTVMAENENCVFLTDSVFNPEYPILARVKAVAFPELPEGPEGPLRVAGLYIASSASRMGKEGDGEEDKQRRGEDMEREILEAILKRFQKQEMETLRGVKNAYEKGKRGVSPYAMIKPLDENENKPENENPTFEISLMLD